MVPKAGTLLYEGFVCLGAGAHCVPWRARLRGHRHRSVPAALPPERAPPVSLHASPVPPRPRPDPVFPGLGTAQPPKTDGFVLPILLGKQYSALFTTLLKAPVKTITAGKPRPEYSAYPPVSTQIDAKNFRQEKKHTYSPQTQNRCLP